MWVAVLSGCLRGALLFFFKQKTADEMRISDWSSDVCSSDLVLSIADVAYVISNGQVLARGTPDEIRSSPSEYVQQFLQGRPDGPVAFHFKAKSLADDLREHA